MGDTDERRVCRGTGTGEACFLGGMWEEMGLVDGERDLGERVQRHRGTWGRWPLCEHRRLGLGAASGASTRLVR